MTCPTCGSKKARRACPALGRAICTVCCGTKRLVEIACPSACGYLATARSHPPAVVARQQQRDLRFAMPMVHKLPETAYRVLLVLQEAIRRHESSAVPALRDEDVVEAAGALASTLETSARGIIYEHQPASLPAQRLLADLQGVLTEVGRALGIAIERDAASALRRIERAARGAAPALGEGDRSYLAFLARLPTGPATSPEEAPPDDSGGGTAARLIVP